MRLDSAENSRGGGRSFRSRAWLYGLLVFSAALSVRLGYLAALPESPFFDVRLARGSDQFHFFTWGLAILDGYGLGEGVYYQSPFYPYFLALIFKLSGGGNLAIPRFVQLLLGSFTAVFAFLLGLRLGGGRVGLLAGLITACYGPLFFYEAAFLRDGPVTFFYAGFLLLLFWFKERPGVFRFFLSGICFGLCLLAKPSIMAMVPVVMGTAYFAAGEVSFRVLPARSERGNGEAAARRGVRLLAALVLLSGFAGGALLSLSPLVYRNLKVGEAAFALTKSGPLEFIAGNLPESPPSGLEVTPRVARLAEEARGSTARAALLVLKSWRNRPLGFPARLLKKTWVFLNGYEVPNNLNYYIEKRYVRFMRFPWLNWPVLLALCAAGMWAMRKKWRQWFELYGFVFVSAAGVILFFVVGRFRAPLVPAMAVFAAAGLMHFAKLIKEKNAGPLLAYFAFTAGLLVLTWPRPDDPLRPNDYHNLVRYHMLKKEPELARTIAEEGLRRAEGLAERKRDGESYYRAARLAFLAGRDLEEAAAWLDKAEAAGSPLWVKPLVASLREEIKRRAREGDLKPGGFRFLGAHKHLK